MTEPTRKPLIAVCGAGVCGPEMENLAYETGWELAARGAVLVCGGRGGIMAAAARGARKNGGLTVGVLPGLRPEDANPYIDIALATGLGEARNAVITRSARAIIALPGSHGTLSEVALGLKMGKKVIGLTAWEHVPGVIPASSPSEAAARALDNSLRPETDSPA